MGSEQLFPDLGGLSIATLFGGSESDPELLPSGEGLRQFLGWDAFENRLGLVPFLFQQSVSAQIPLQLPASRTIRPALKHIVCLDPIPEAYAGCRHAGGTISKGRRQGLQQSRLRMKRFTEEAHRFKAFSSLWIVLSQLQEQRFALELFLLIAS